MPKKAKATKKQEGQFLIDIEIPLPEEYKHLVEGGTLILYFNAETRDVIRDIASELMLSRRLPVDIESVGIDDLMTVWLIRQRKEEFADDDGSGVILAARHVYGSQIQDTNREAMILALTGYTEISAEFDDAGNLVQPAPIKSGQNILSLDSNTGRKKSTFLKLVQKTADDIPEVNRNLNNKFEARLKWLEDTINAAGPSFYRETVQSINRSVIKIIGDLPEKDPDGFPSEPIS